MQWGMMLHCYAWQSPGDTLHGLLQILALASVAEPEIPLALLAEGRTGSEADIGFLDETDRHIFRATAPANLEEGVERAGRRRQIHKARLRQTADDLAAFLGARNLMGDEFLSLVECGYSGPLDEGGGARRRV